MDEQRPYPLTILVAAAENGVIGRDGDLPWRLAADLARFKRLTMGHAIIMGRKTYESIGRPLPGRVSVVLTRDATWRPGHDGVLVAGELTEACHLASRAEGIDPGEVFVIGGGEIYRLALPETERIHLTRVHTTVEGDATFPPLDPTEWRRIESKEHPADDRNEHAFTFEIYERIGAAAD